MCKLGTIFFLLICSFTLKAQNNIKGVFLTIKGEPLQFLTVDLLNKDFKDIKHEITNEKGEFGFQGLRQGMYSIQVVHFTDTIFLKEIKLDSNIDLGTIKVEVIKKLEEIVVQGKKKIIEHKIDRLVFNVENSINATGSDAFEMLKITPRISVRNDNISMIGKSAMVVMVNDRIIELTGDDLAAYLKSLPSDDIKSIEVITNPPAKYEALGSSGIINIKTKKASRNSWNANVGTTYQQRSRSTGTVLGGFNYNKNKLSFSSSINYKNGSRLDEQNNFTYFPDALWYTRTPTIESSSNLNIRLGLDYRISKNWISGLQYLFNAANLHNDRNVFLASSGYSRGDTLQYLESNSLTRIKQSMNSTNWYNEFTLDSLKSRKIVINLDYFDYKNTDKRPYDGTSVIQSPFSKQFFKLISNNIQSISNFSAKVDVEYPLKWIEISLGGQLSYSKTGNALANFNSGFVNSPVLNYNVAESDFNYDENIKAIYISGNKKINSKWEVQGGLRMEATTAKSYYRDSGKISENKYNKFFPTAYVSYSPNDNITFNLTYGKRIDRPTFSALNPNRYYSNPFQSIEGNPLLQPAYINNLELNFSYKNFDHSLYYLSGKNMFSQIAITDSVTKETRNVNLNFIKVHAYGIGETYTFNKIKWWESSNSLYMEYVVTKSSLPFTSEGFRGLNASVSTSNDFMLTSKKTLVLNAMYNYTFPIVDGIYKYLSASSFSMAVQYFMLNRNLKITLRGNDIFRNDKFRYKVETNGTFQKGDRYRDEQFIQLALSYKFGNKKVKVGQRDLGNEKERSRTGN